MSGSLVYVFFGTIKEVSIGPTGLMALLTLQYTMDKPIQYAIVLTFLAGCIEFLMGILKLGIILFDLFELNFDSKNCDFFKDFSLTLFRFPLQMHLLQPQH